MSTMSIPILPDSAPFTPGQRAWLNGFFAAIFGIREGRSQAAAQSASEPAAVEESFSWHDPALPLDERLKLAEGRPIERLLMASMAQLDCGACGYLCQTYAEAIAHGQEKDLTRCAPGGKETSRKLKELVASHRVAAQVIPAPQARPKRGAEPAHTRLHPFASRLTRCEMLNSPGSGKDTRLVALDLKGSGIRYEVGDSLGVWPENCPDAVTWLLETLDASGSEKVPAPDGALTTLREALLRRYAITKSTPALIELMTKAAGGPADRAALERMMADDGPEAPDGCEPLDLLRQFPSARPPVEEFAASLSPLQPRLYSISSSQRAHPDELHLTVGVVRYLNGHRRQCRGVASTYLAERVRPGQKVSIFVQPSHCFRLPTSSNAPVIMVGPGTGIAPFRAFLQDRKAAGAKGKNWLFFGDQRAEFDFLYRDEIESYLRDGVLTRLATAFSRDQQRKLYVQHRMLESAADVWAWLKEGAHFYVCGDAKRMAADVDQALKQIVAVQGKMTAEQAKAFVADLAKAGRYQRDVY